jgi:hypothetical protein
LFTISNETKKDEIFEMIKLNVMDLQRQVAGFEIQTLHGAGGAGELFPGGVACHFQAGL